MGLFNFKKSAKPESDDSLDIPPPPPMEGAGMEEIPPPTDHPDMPTAGHEMLPPEAHAMPPPEMPDTHDIPAPPSFPGNEEMPPPGPDLQNIPPPPGLEQHDMPPPGLEQHDMPPSGLEQHDMPGPSFPPPGLDSMPHEEPTFPPPEVPQDKFPLPHELPNDFPPAHPDEPKEAKPFDTLLHKPEIGRPLFVEIGKYKGVLKDLNGVKKSLKLADDELSELVSDVQDEEKTFSKLHGSLVDVEKKLMELESSLFEQ